MLAMRLTFAIQIYVCVSFVKRYENMVLTITKSANNWRTTLKI